MFGGCPPMFRSVWRKWLGLPSRSTKQKRRPTRPNLRVEQLEDRLVLANSVATVAVGDLTPDTAAAGALKVPILFFQCHKNTGSPQLDSLTVHFTGTNKTDVATVYLYRESGTVAGSTFSPSSDNLLGSTSTINASNDAVLVASSAQTIPTGDG